MAPQHTGTGDTRHPFFLGLLALATVGFGALLLGFWQPIFWAIVLGILFLPVKNRLERRLPGKPSLVAALTVVLIFFTVLVPALLVASAVASEAALLLERIQAGEFDPGVILEWVQNLIPPITEWAARFGINLNEWQDKLSGAALKGSQFIASLALTAGQNVARFVVMFFLMLYVLFFVVRDGEVVLGHAEQAMPLTDSLERRLGQKFAEVARATLKGTVIVGIVQGALGGIIFAILGIQGAVFWGCVMVIMSVVPAIGPGLVWFPAALVLLATGSVTKGLVLIAYGVLVIGLVDNLLRPLLVGRDTKMPDYLVLLSTLGGLAMFGITGFVLGPVVAALFLTVWQMFEAESQAAKQSTEDVG
ncbi:MAG: AI-2E family transporter [Chromatiales bacterium]|nr:MAG: AI-2E family transporter [Chromatiales bacterium]